MSPQQEREYQQGDHGAVLKDRLEQLKAALVADARVREVWQEELDPYYSGIERYYPDRNLTTDDDILAASDSFYGLYFTTPLFVSINVPVKNQPRHHGADDIPTDDYLIAWDGVTACVGWQQEDDSGLLPLSGGHVGFNILSEALAKIGSSLYNQACTPECKNLFFHSVGVLRDSGDRRSGTEFVAATDYRGVDVSLPSLDDLEDGLTWLMLSIGLIAKEFSQLKNKGQRLLDIYEIAEESTSSVVALQYSGMSMSSAGIGQILRQLRHIVRGKRQIRLTLARAWLCLAHIETLRRQWYDRSESLGEWPGQQGFVDQFLAGDFADDFQRIGRLDTVPIRAALDSVSVRLDTGAIVVATAFGGVAGAVAGFLAAILG